MSAYRTRCASNAEKCHIESAHWFITESPDYFKSKSLHPHPLSKALAMALPWLKRGTLLLPAVGMLSWSAMAEGQLRWSGAQNNVWNTTTQNWLDASNNPAAFANGATLTFPAASNKNINIAAGTYSFLATVSATGYGFNGVPSNDPDYGNNNNKQTTILSPSASGTFFSVATNNPNFNNLMIKNSDSSITGSAIAGGKVNLNISNSSFAGITATNGTVVEVGDGSTLRLNKVNIYGTRYTGNDMAAISSGGTLNLDITNSIVSGNSTTSRGAAIVLRGGGSLRGAPGGTSYADFSGSLFLSNSSGWDARWGSGGALQVDANANLIAASGDVVFQGNSNSKGPNAIRFVLAATANLAANKDRTIYFYDPISNRSEASNFTFNFNPNAGHQGTILFDGYNWKDTSATAGALNSDVYFTSAAGASVSYGTLQLNNGHVFGAADNTGTFTVGPAATLKIAYGQTSRTWGLNDDKSFTVDKGTGAGDPDGEFTVAAVPYNANKVATINAGNLNVNGTLSYDLPTAAMVNGNSFLKTPGNVTLSNSATIVLSSLPTGFTSGQALNLIEITGSGTLSFSPNLTVNGGSLLPLPTHRDANAASTDIYFALAATSNLLKLQVSSPADNASLVWTGLVAGGVWNQDSAGSTTVVANWVGRKNGGALVNTFINGDTVAFNDQYDKDGDGTAETDVDSKAVNIAAGTYTLGSGGAAVNAAGYSFTGADAATTVIDSAKQFVLSSAANTLGIANLTLKNATSGALTLGNAYTVLTIEGVVFANNKGNTGAAISDGRTNDRGLTINTGSRIINSVFVGNESTSWGSAISTGERIFADFSGTRFFNNTSLTDTIYATNRTAGGGAIHSDDNFTITANTGDLIFAGNKNAAGINAINVGNAVTAQLFAGTGYTIALYDPLRGNAFTFNSSTSSPGLTYTGTILLDRYQSNTRGAASVAAGTLVLQNGAVWGVDTNASAFTVNDGATLKIAYGAASPVRDANGQVHLSGSALSMAIDQWENPAYSSAKVATINAGSLTIAGAAEFDLNGIADGNTLLYTPNAVSLAATGKIALSALPSSLVAGQAINLITITGSDADDVFTDNRTSHTTLYVGSTPYSFHRDAGKSDLVYGLRYDNTGSSLATLPLADAKSLQLLVGTQNDTANALYWTGAESGVWNQDKAAATTVAHNWQGRTVNGILVDTFINGDTVVFADQYDSNGDGTVDTATSKTVNLAAGTYTFSGTINATGYSFTGTTISGANTNQQTSIIEKTVAANRPFTLDTAAVNTNFSNLKFVNSSTETMSDKGGALLVNTGPYTGTISNTSFSGFNVNGTGGAVYVAGFNGRIDHSNFYGNRATSYGGALSVYTNGFAGDITNSIFSGNHSNSRGGAIAVVSNQGLYGPAGTSDSFADFSGSMFLGNTNSFNNTGWGPNGAINTDLGISLIVQTGDLVFQGNSGVNTAPVSIFILNNYNNQQVRLAAGSNRTIYFYDPIYSIPSPKDLTLEFNPANTHTGTILFDGYNWANTAATAPALQSKIYFQTGNGSINYGTLQLNNGHVFGATANTGAFTVAANATLKIAYAQGSKVYNLNADGSYSGDITEITPEQTAWSANRIATLNAGSLTIAGQAEFDLTGIANGNTLLQTPNAVNFASTGKIVLSAAPSSFVAGQAINLITITGSDADDVFTDDRANADRTALYMGSTPYAFNRDTSKSDLVYGLRYDNTDTSLATQPQADAKSLQLLVGAKNDSSNALYWTGAVSGTVWNQDTDAGAGIANWQGRTSSGILVDTFINGDSVIFNAQYDSDYDGAADTATPKAVNLRAGTYSLGSAGIAVNAANYSFTGADAATTIIDSANQFVLSGDADKMSLTRLTLTNATNSAVTIKTNTTLTLNSVVFASNQGSSGAAIGDGRMNSAGYNIASGSRITNSVFVGNQSTSGGGAIHTAERLYADFSNTRFFNNTSLNDTLYGDRTAGAGAIQVDDGFSISANSGDVIFAGNRSAAGVNAVNLGVFSSPGNDFSQMYAGAGRTIFFYDPIRSGAAGTRSFTFNDAERTGTVVFDRYQSEVRGATTVAAGTLALQNGAIWGRDTNTSTFSLERGATLNVVYGKGLSPKRNADGSITTSGEGLAMAIGTWDNDYGYDAAHVARINAGTTTLKGNLAFQYENDMASGSTLLQSNGATTLADSNKLVVAALPGFTTAGQYLTLIQSDTRLLDQRSAIASFYTGTTSLTEQSFARDNSATLVYGIAYDTQTGIATSDTKELRLVLAAANEVATGLTWNGSVDANWNSATRNWQGVTASSKVNISTFMNNDSVVFDTTGFATNPHVVIDNAGVRVNNMEVSRGYTFSGGKLTLTGNLSVAAKNGTTAEDVSFANDLTGTGSLNKSESGTLTLTGNNDYTGGTTVSAGTLQIGNASTTGTLAGNVNLAATSAKLVFNRSNAYTYSGAISGNGSVQVAGAGTTTLAGASSYTGTTIIDAGMSLILTGTLDSDRATPGFSHSGAINNNGTLTFNQSQDQTLTGSLSDSGVWIKEGTKTLTLANNYVAGSASYTINAGKLEVKQAVTADSFTFHTKLNAGAASGTLRFDLGDTEKQLKFGATTGTAFKGIVEVANATVLLAAGDTSDSVDDVLNGGSGSATLKLSEGGLAIFRSDSGTLNNLTFDGGILNIAAFDSSGGGTNKLILSGTLTVDGDSGVVRIGTDDLENIDVDHGTLLSSFYDYTTGADNYQQILVSATTVTADAYERLELQDVDGNPFVDVTSELTIDGGTEAVGKAIFNYNATVISSAQASALGKEAGIWLGFGLAELEAYANKTINVDSSDSSVLVADRVLNAKLTGEGNYNFTGNKAAQLGNGNSDYTGETTVSGVDGSNKQVLTLIANNAFGQTSRLTLNFAEVNIGSNKLTVGALVGSDSSSVIRLATSADGQKTGSLQVGVNADIARSGNGEYAGTISGAGGLLKEGNGTLVLTGSNDYSGGTVVNGGILQIGKGSTSGAIVGNVAVGTGATLHFNRSDDISFGGTISGNGSLSKASGNTLTLTADNTFTGSTVVTFGKLQLGSGTGGGSSGSVTGDVGLGGGTELIFNRSDDALNYGGAISGEGKVSFTGSGMVTLTGSSSYSGGTTISSGMVNFNKAANFGADAANITLNGGGLQWASGTSTDISSRLTTIGSGGATFDLNGNDVTLATGLSATGLLTKSGTGMLTLTGSNSFNGGLAVAKGSLQVGNGGSSGDLSGNVEVAADTSLSFNRSTAVSYSGVLSGAGALRKMGTGTLTLTGANSFTGGTTVSGGLINFNRADNFGAANITLNGGGLQWADGVTLDISGRLNPLGTAGGVLDTNGNDVTLATALSGAAESSRFAKAGSGTLILTATNTYQGGTTVKAGVLQIGNGGTSGAIVGDVAVESGADLVFKRSDAISFTGKISGAGRLTQKGTGVLTIARENTYSGGTTIEAGTINFNALNNFGTGMVSINGGTLQWAVDTSTDISPRLTALGANGATLDTNGNDVTLASALSGAATASALTKAGDGTLTLTATNTYQGGTTVKAGVLQIGNGGTSGAIVGDVEVAVDADLSFKRSDAIVFDGQISGAGSLTQKGSGVLTLAHVNTFSGGTTIEAGTINFNALNNFGTGTVTLNGGTLQWAANTSTDISPRLTVIGANGGSFDTNGNDVSFAAPLPTSAAALAKNGAGTLTLNGDSSAYTGTFSVNNGTLALADAAVGGNVTLTTMAASHGELSIIESATIAGNLVTNGNVLNFSLPDSPDGTTLLTVAGAEDLSLGNMDAQGRIVVDGLDKLTVNNGVVTLIDKTQGSIEGVGQLWRAGDDSPYAPHRGVDPWLYGLYNNNNESLELHAVTGVGLVGGGDADERRDHALVWTGKASAAISALLGVWDADTTSQSGTANWDGNVDEAIHVYTFFHGDSVLFNDQGEYQAPQHIVVDAAGVTVGDMLMFGSYPDAPVAYNFTGGAIDATTQASTNAQGEVVIKNAVLGLEVVDQLALTAVNVTFDSNSALNIAGYAVSDLDDEKKELIRASNSITGFDPLQVTVAGEDDVNFLRAVATLENNSIWVETGLNWNAHPDHDGDDRPHGEFDISEGNSFTLDVPLADRDDLSVDSEWDGQTLVKNGLGTLILTAANTYTGGTTINAGTVMLGNGGTTGSIESDVLNNGTLAYNRADDVLVDTYTISGSGGVIQMGGGDLYLIGDHSYTGTTRVLNGSFTLQGSVGGDVQLTSGTAFSLNGSVAGSVRHAADSRLDVRHSGTIGGNFTAVASELNFYVAEGTTAGAQLLQVGGAASISDSSLRVGIEGASSPLNPGDYLVLIDAASLSYSNSSATANAEGLQGVTLRYDFDIVQRGNQLLAMLSTIGTNEESKALSEAYLSSVTLLNQSGDLLATQAIEQAMAARGDHLVNTFATISGGKGRYKSGSYIDVDSWLLAGGVAFNFVSGTNEMMLGIFYEHGKGSYDTFNSFANAADVRGDGDSKHDGVGLLARLHFANSESGYYYVEASGRVGEVDTDFHSDTLLNAKQQATSYDSRTPYFGVHLGAGRLWQINSATDLDVYAKYFHTQRDGDTVTLNSGDRIEFSSVKSQRLRVGARLAHDVGRLQPYFGLAWEHEFKGEARATSSGLPIDAPELKGHTGILEAGLKTELGKRVELNFGMQGYVGKREGVSANLQLKVKF